MQIVPLIDPYAIHFDKYSSGIYTLNSDSISLLAGTLGANILELAGAINSDNNWRLTVSGNDLLFQVKINGTWTTAFTRERPV